MRPQAGEDLVELGVGHRPGDPRGHLGPIGADTLVSMRLHRVVMGMGPSAPPSSAQRERVGRRPAVRVAVEIVEGSQHRLAVSPHRRRVALAHTGSAGAGDHACRMAPMRPRRLVGHLQPTREVPGVGARRVIPRQPHSPAEPEPPQQVQTIRAQGRLRPPRRLQLSEPRRHRLHRRATAVDEPIGHPRVVGGRQTTHLSDDHRRQVPRRFLLGLHGRGCLAHLCSTQIASELRLCGDLFSK